MRYGRTRPFRMWVRRIDADPAPMRCNVQNVTAAPAWFPVCVLVSPRAGPRQQETDRRFHIQAGPECILYHHGAAARKSRPTDRPAVCLLARRPSSVHCAAFLSVEQTSERDLPVHRMRQRTDSRMDGRTDGRTSKPASPSSKVVLGRAFRSSAAALGQQHSS